MKKQISFHGKISVVHKNDKQFARATYVHLGKRKEVWRLVLDNDFEATAREVKSAIEVILNQNLSRKQWVYLVHARGTNFYKIGIASCVKTRLHGLQNASPHELSLVTVIPGSQSLEKAIHRRFRGHRVRGEWFEFKTPTEPLVAFEECNSGREVVTF